MKKLCAFILAITAAVSVFAYQSFSYTEIKPQAVTANVSNTLTSTVTENSENIVAKDSDKIITYICNKNTKKFHLPSCCTLPKEKNRVYISSYERAINRGFAPCKNCNP